MGQGMFVCRLASDRQASALLCQEELRDKGKGVKWAKMLANDEVDEATQEAWKACKARVENTALINAILQKDEDENTGVVRYKFQPDSNWIKELFYGVSELKRKLMFLL